MSLTRPTAGSWSGRRRPASSTATGDGARLLVSSAILTEAVDVDALLAKLAETQRALGFEVGDTFSDRLGGAAGGRFPGDRAV